MFVCSGGRVVATPVPFQVHANAQTTERLSTRDVKHSKALQGTMIWFFINTHVSDDD